LDICEEYFFLTLLNSQYFSSFSKRIHEQKGMVMQITQV